MDGRYRYQCLKVTILYTSGIRNRACMRKSEKWNKKCKDSARFQKCIPKTQRDPGATRLNKMEMEYQEVAVPHPEPENSWEVLHGQLEFNSQHNTTHTVLWLLFWLFIFENYVNAPLNSNKQKNCKFFFYFGNLVINGEIAGSGSESGSGSISQRHGSWSTRKCHGAATLVYSLHNLICYVRYCVLVLFFTNFRLDYLLSLIFCVVFALSLVWIDLETCMRRQSLRLKRPSFNCLIHFYKRFCI